MVLLWITFQTEHREILVRLEVGCTKEEWCDCMDPCFIPTGYKETTKSEID